MTAPIKGARPYRCGSVFDDKRVQAEARFKGRLTDGSNAFWNCDGVNVVMMNVVQWGAVFFGGK